MYRHGDLLIVKSSVPAHAMEVGDSVLAYGEITGHSHKVRGAAVLERDDVRYISAPNGAMVTHEEHNTIQLPPGEWEVIRQREYDPYEQAARQVAD
jgi:hypothetical protein